MKDEVYKMREFIDMSEEDSYDYPDAHSCSANADADGYCTVCGAIIPGSWADLDSTGCDPV